MSFPCLFFEMLVFNKNLLNLWKLSPYDGKIKQKQPLELFCKKGVLKNFSNFTEKHLCWSLFLQPSGLQLIKKILQGSCFHVNFATILRTFLLKNIRKRLLLMFPFLKIKARQLLILAEMHFIWCGLIFVRTIL